MTTILKLPKLLLSEFSASLEVLGLSEHMVAARGFARDGVSASELYMLMRGNFPKPVIAALIAEAHEQQQSELPVIR